MKYFGTDLSSHGHFIWKVNAHYLSNASIDIQSLSFDPEAMPLSKVNGVAELTHKDNLTILAICGSCKDNRPGCKSVFWVENMFSLKDMVVLIKSYPILEQILNKLDEKYTIKWPDNTIKANGF